MTGELGKSSECQFLINYIFLIQRRDFERNFVDKLGAFRFRQLQEVEKKFSEFRMACDFPQYYILLLLSRDFPPIL